MTMKSTQRVLGHSLVRSLIHSHRTLAFPALLVYFARFAALLRLFAHSLAPELMGIRKEGLNASISCSFNPLWPARSCVYVCMFVCVCV